MDSPVALDGSLAQLSAGLELRANSLIITLFGDAVVPRGGNIWLGSLIGLLAPFGLSERLVRTGVYRLSREGWLEARTRGRRAYYTLTGSGRAKFAAADRRIYAADAPSWDGRWRLVHLLPGISRDARRALRRELHWLGFGQLSQTLLAHPTADASMLKAVLDDLELAREVLVFTAELAAFVAPATVGAAASTAWELDGLNGDYGRFLKTFSTFCEDPDSLSELAEPDCLALRVLLIHDYRRILLKDPRLPGELLPPDWNGERARAVCMRIYTAIAARADAHLARSMETLDGSVPAPSAEYWRRFGGLPGR
jgi:phenylacetic acid degradation operon negative regulatory protein